MRHIVTHLGAESAIGKARISQNGVKYRTLCGRCNSGLLGTLYDPALIEFTNAVGNFLKTQIKLPPVINIPAKPQLVIRSVLGHMAAVGVDRYLKGAHTEEFKELFLDESLPIREWVRVYYWPYPFNRQILIRDCALTDLRVREPVVIWLMKFFPIAFMVTFNEPQGYTFAVQELTRLPTSPGGAGVVDVPIVLRPIVHQFWPEAPTPRSIVMYGQEAVWAQGRPKRGAANH